jgi:excisionase family DNA binding protein
MNFLTVTQAAQRLNLSTSRVRALIKAGRLPAMKPGHDWLIKESDLKLVANRKPGAPAGNRNGRGRTKRK